MKVNDVLICVCFLMLIAGCSRRSSTVKSNMPEIIQVESDDAEMNRAMQEARDHFSEFWKVLEEDHHRVIPVHADALVKAYFEDRPGSRDGEHMWVAQIEYDGKLISGELIDTPGHVTTVKAGQKVTFPIERLSDWLYTKDQIAIGAYTVRLLRTRMSPEERRQHDSVYPFRFE